MKLYPNLIYFLFYNFILFTLCQPAKHVFYKAKGKVRPRTGHEGPEGEYSYSCTL